MLGIRASPSGRYVLVLLRGAPSEIWAVSESDLCIIILHSSRALLQCTPQS